MTQIVRQDDVRVRLNRHIPQIRVVKLLLPILWRNPRQKINQIPTAILENVQLVVHIPSRIMLFPSALIRIQRHHRGARGLVGKP